MFERMTRVYYVLSSEKIKLYSGMCSVIPIYIESDKVVKLDDEITNNFLLVYVSLYFSNVLQKTGIAFKIGRKVNTFY